MTKIFMALVLVLAILCGQAFAEMQINGFVENQERVRVAEVEDEQGDSEYPFDLMMADTWFDLQFRTSGYDGQTRMFVDADVKYFALEHVENADLRIREAWAGYYSQYFSFEFGKKIYSWGVTDEMNPIDLICAEDLRWFYTYDKAQRKLGAYSADIALSYKNFKLEGVWVPIFTPTTLPESHEDWTPWKLQLFYDFRDLYPDFVNFSSQNYPATKLKNSAGALRFTGVVGPVDFSLMAYDGWDPLPTYDIRIIPDASALIDGSKPVQIKEHYQRYNAFGAGITGAAGPITFRAEGAYYTDRWFMHEVDENLLSPSSLLAAYELLLQNKDQEWRSQKPSLNFVGGVDYRYSSWLYTNVQYFQIQILDYEDILLDKEYENGLSGKIEFSLLDEMLRLGVDGAYNVTQEDWTAKVYANYMIADSLEVEGGWTGFGGDYDTNFGEFDDNDYAFTRFRFAF